MVRVLLTWFVLLALWHPEPADALVVLGYHDVRDDVNGKLDPDRDAISSKLLVEHFEWLKSRGYPVVSFEQVLAAESQGPALPENAILLTFDDGLESIYTRVLPLLRAYRYPAVVAVVGRWLDLKPGETVDYAGRKLGREDFLTPVQIREIADSGLVEIASHSYDLHKAVSANPLGSVMPAAVTRIWDKDSGYESETTWRERLHADLKRSKDQIKSLTGKNPRAMVWPYGATGREANSIAADLGMRVAFDLGGRDQARFDGGSIARILLSGNPDVHTLAWEIRHEAHASPIRAVQVDLDYVYDPDPAQHERNLGALVSRIYRLGVNQVYLQAFADPDGDGAADAMYFPNRHLPMRADLYSRVSWQLRTRAGVHVYAWMPVLAFVLPDAAKQTRLSIRAVAHAGRRDPPRLDPTIAESRSLIGDIYEDLTAAGFAGGLLFGDDAVLRDDDGLSASAPAPGRERTLALIKFTDELARRAARWRAPLKTVRNLFAQPVLDAEAERWTAQDLGLFLARYDQVALMAMPHLESAEDVDAWLKNLAAKVLAVPGARQRTVFEIQTRDWKNGKPIDVENLVHEIRLLQQVGVFNLGYYPDDFLKNQPDLQRMREVISASEFPYPKP